MGETSCGFLVSFKTTLSDCLRGKRKYAVIITNIGISRQYLSGLGKKECEFLKYGGRAVSV